MNSKLEIHPIPYGTPSWHQFRLNGIGGSEVGSILNLNKWETAARIYHEKIGNLEPQTEDTEFMFWGRRHEDAIADTWQYWDGTDEGYIENQKAGKIIRKCRRINGYAVNPDYPWLFASLDRLINKEGGINMLTEEVLTEEAILECKTLSHWAASSWEDGLPIYFITQIQTYMIVYEVDYAEIAILKDGNKFSVEYVQRDDKLCQQIIDFTKSFWYDRVVPAKKALEARSQYELEGRIEESEKEEAIIGQLEPDPDGTEAYREFMSEKFLKEREEVEGSMEMFDICKKDEMLKKMEGRIKKERSLFKNTLIKWIVDKAAEFVDFDSLGNYRFYLRKGGKNRTLAINIKEKPGDERVEEEFNKFNLEY